MGREQLGHVREHGAVEEQFEGEGVDVNHGDPGTQRVLVDPGGGGVVVGQDGGQDDERSTGAGEARGQHPGSLDAVDDEERDEATGDGHGVVPHVVDQLSISVETQAAVDGRAVVVDDQHSGGLDHDDDARADQDPLAVGRSQEHGRPGAVEVPIHLDRRRYLAHLHRGLVGGVEAAECPLRELGPALHHQPSWGFGEEEQRDQVERQWPAAHDEGTPPGHVVRRGELIEPVPHVRGQRVAKQDADAVEVAQEAAHRRGRRLADPHGDGPDQHEDPRAGQGAEGDEHADAHAARQAGAGHEADCAGHAECPEAAPPVGHPRDGPDAQHAAGEEEAVRGRGELGAVGARGQLKVGEKGGLGQGRPDDGSSVASAEGPRSHECRDEHVVETELTLLYMFEASRGLLVELHPGAKRFRKMGEIQLSCLVVECSECHGGI